MIGLTVDILEALQSVAGAGNWELTSSEASLETDTGTGSSLRINTLKTNHSDFVPSGKPYLLDLQKQFYQQGSKRSNIWTIKGHSNHHNKESRNQANQFKKELQIWSESSQNKK